MKLKIIYLGKIKELTEKDNQQIEIEKGMSVQDLIDQLTVEYPHLAFESFQISVNRNLVEFSHVLTEEADIALLPPFSGG